MTVTNRAALACNGWLQTGLQIGWRKVTLRLSTHSAKGLTEKDFDLARKADGAV